MIKRCAVNCYPIALIMMCAGVFVGVMNGSGMLGRDIKDVIKFCFPRLLFFLVLQFAISAVLGFIPIGS